MKKLSFKEYYDSKKQLVEASANKPKIINEYIVKKYCKIPLIDENHDKDYVGLKPKDNVKILWEFHDVGKPHAKNITINDITYLPCWNDEKLKRWIDQTTLELKSK